jgi:hypothetical protein
MVHPEHRKRQVASAPDAAKIVQILPPNLEALQVQLEKIRVNCRTQGAFEHISRAEDIIEHYDILLHWIENIAVWKHSHVPALKEVIVWSPTPSCRMRRGCFMSRGLKTRF